MNILPLKQGDLRWGSVKVGTGDASFSEVGCLVTDVTMMLNAFGGDFMPNEVNTSLIEKGGFVYENLLVFSSVQAIPPGIKMRALIDCSARPAPLDEIDKHLADGELALVELRPISNANTQLRHWVLMYAKTADDYFIADPLDGTLKKLSAYGWGKWDSKTIIMRAVFYGSDEKKAIGTTAPGVRFRREPGGLVFGNLPINTPVKVLDDGREWTRVSINGFVSTQFLGEIPVSPPVPPVPLPVTPTPPPIIVVPPNEARRPRIGVNVLNRHEEVALGLAKRGCRYFNVLDNVGFASRLKREYPDAIVSVRRYWNHQLPSVDGYLAAMDGCADKGLIYLGANENDEVGDDYMGIQKRFEWERGIITKLNEIGATFAMGGFSMGSPNFLDDAICGVIKRLYAPIYNAGRASWNHHLYSPNMLFGQADRAYGLDDVEVEQRVGKGNTLATWAVREKSRGINTPISKIWFETRWQFLFTQCGFDENSPSRIYCDEAGVDEGGVGGFPAHNATASDVARWAKWWLNAQAEPINGKPSPMMGGAIFQVGNREDWNGYNVENLLGEVQF